MGVFVEFCGEDNGLVVGPGCLVIVSFVNGFGA